MVCPFPSHRCEEILDEGVELCILKGILTAATSCTFTIHGQAGTIFSAEACMAGGRMAGGCMVEGCMAGGRALKRDVVHGHLAPRFHSSLLL